MKNDLCQIYCRLNSLKLEKTLLLYPQRIILIRHGEVGSLPCVCTVPCEGQAVIIFNLQSEGNVDNSLYMTKPDRAMKLTPLGVQQAYVRSKSSI